MLFFKSSLACQVTQWCIYIINSLVESLEIENNASFPPAVPKDPLLLRFY